jgi:glycine dehydrogenase subunit 1
MAHLRELAGQNRDAEDLICFLGAGIYDHFIPPVVDFVASRSEFSTSYTPYQAEASQGNLQVFFEYQTLICQLAGMEVANASLYDGATALAESVLMAQNIAGRNGVAVSEGVHPEYSQTLRTYLRHLDCPWQNVAIDGGVTSARELDRIFGSDTRPGVVAVQQPNFFGGIENLPALADAAHRAGALLVVTVNPISLGLLKSPGECGADIVCGEGQCLGIPPSFGGPGLGLLATRLDYVRKLPGRIAGKTTHSRGGEAFVLTLQTREQHIRRERATSNICTNHALLALRAAVYLCALGKAGVRQIATLCTQKAHALAERLAVAGYPPAHKAPFFHEFVIDCGRPAEQVVEAMLAEGYLAGLPLRRFFPHRPNQLLICVTEQRSTRQVEEFGKTLVQTLKSL